MQTSLDPALANKADLTEVDRILRSCVHCGFCTSGCPTYQLLGDENDSPRGRIYLMKQAFEGEATFEGIAPHLDRCLTCRNCETNCPSGVEYSRLLDITRGLMFETSSGPAARRYWHRTVSWLLRKRGLMRGVFGVGRFLRRLPGLKDVSWLPFPRLHPSSLELKSAPVASIDGAKNQQVQSPGNGGKVLLLRGCIQQFATPGAVAALARILEHYGYEPIYLGEEACCGALPYHMGDHEAGLMDLATLDAQLNSASDDIVAILSSASGCAAMLLQLDDQKLGVSNTGDAEASLSKKILDPVSFLAQLPPIPIKRLRVGVHQPCTQSHALKLNDAVQGYLASLGFDITGSNGKQGCCGSAGTYSLLEPRMAGELRDEMLRQLESAAPDVIVTANVGCQVHLDRAGQTPVMHWLELLDKQMIV